MKLSKHLAVTVTALLVYFIFNSLQLFAQKSDRSRIIESEMKAAMISRMSSTTNTTDNYNIVYDRCEWHINPGFAYITGAVTTYFIPNALLDSIEFDFSIALNADSIYYHGAQTSFSQFAGDLLSINLSPAAAPGVVDSVTIYYKGIPPVTGFGSFQQSTHLSAPIVWTLSEPYGASDWWPCKSNLTDKIDSMDIFITCPQPYRGASNGSFINELTLGGNVTTHWQHRYPISTYLVGIAVTNYYTYTDTVHFNGHNVPMVNYTYPEDSSSAHFMTQALVPVMQLYDTLFGEYPFYTEKYGHAQFGWGGGMEHQTMTFIGGWWYDVMIHELAHQWFGDAVTCGSWHDIWLNEGWATYLSQLVTEHYDNANWMNAKQSLISSVTSSPNGSVYNPDTLSLGRIFDSRLTYDKGAMLAHMLRWVCGDSAFFAGMKNYIANPTYRYSFARTANLQHELELASSKSLITFFNQWYYGEGYPSYNIVWDENGANVVNLTISQTQSHVSVNFFEMPVPVLFRNSTQDTTIVFNHLFSGQSFTAALNFHADTAIFDPELWILSRNNHVLLSGINGIPEDKLITIYPVPAQEFIMINYCGPSEIKGWKLFSPEGKVVKESPDTRMHPAAWTIETAGLSTGIYFLKIESGSNVITRKISVIR